MTQRARPFTPGFGPPHIKEAQDRLAEMKAMLREGKTLEEIAAKMGRPVRSVYQSLYRSGVQVSASALARDPAVIARKAVIKAVYKGELPKPKHCETCGRETKVNGHHDDYSRPLDVLWLCGKCHRARHQAMVA